MYKVYLAPVGMWVLNKDSVRLLALWKGLLQVSMGIITESLVV